MMVLWAVWRLAALCARAAIEVWLAALVGGIAALIARAIVMAWRRRSALLERARGAPGCPQGLPE